MPYDDLAVMTGSVTVVEGVPKALYSCRGTENGKQGWSSATVALASAANLSDPLLLRWTKHEGNPVLNPGTWTCSVLQGRSAQRNHTQPPQPPLRIRSQAF